MTEWLKWLTENGPKQCGEFQEHCWHQDGMKCRLSVVGDCREYETWGRQEHCCRCQTVSFEEVYDER